MMKKLVFAFALAVVLSLTLSTGVAQETAQKVFAAMDTNQDGKVDKEEFMNFHMDYATKVRSARFDQLDTNGDGTLSRDEFMAVQIREAEKIGAARFKRIDINGDGVLTEDELKKRFRQFKRALEELQAE